MDKIEPTYPEVLKILQAIEEYYRSLDPKGLDDFFVIEHTKDFHSDYYKFSNDLILQIRKMFEVSTEELTLQQHPDYKAYKPINKNTPIEDITIHVDISDVYKDNKAIVSKFNELVYDENIGIRVRDLLLKKIEEYHDNKSKLIDEEYSKVKDITVKKMNNSSKNKIFEKRMTIDAITNNVHYFPKDLDIEYNPENIDNFIKLPINIQIYKSTSTIMSNTNVKIIKTLTKDPKTLDFLIRTLNDSNFLKEYRLMQYVIDNSYSLREVLDNIGIYTNVLMILFIFYYYNNKWTKGLMSESMFENIDKDDDLFEELTILFDQKGSNNDDQILNFYLRIYSNNRDYINNTVGPFEKRMDNYLMNIIANYLPSRGYIIRNTNFHLYDYKNIDNLQHLTQIKRSFEKIIRMFSSYVKSKVSTFVETSLNINLQDKSSFNRDGLNKKKQTEIAKILSDALNIPMLEARIEELSSIENNTL